MNNSANNSGNNSGNNNSGNSNSGMNMRKNSVSGGRSRRASKKNMKRGKTMKSKKGKNPYMEFVKKNRAAVVNDLGKGASIMDVGRELGKRYRAMKGSSA